MGNSERQRSRAEIADALERDAASGDFGFGDTVVNMVDAAALLRRTCGSCKHFVGHEPGYTECLAAKDLDGRSAFLSVPDDGSGFCHLWTPKAAK